MTVKMVILKVYSILLGYW